MNENTINKLKDQLVDSSRALADITANIVYENPELLGCLTDLVLSEESPYAQRAARVLAICSLQYPELFVRVRQKITGKIARVQNDGVIRNLFMIYAEMPLAFTSKERTVLMNLCFDFLISMKTAVSIKVYSMEILYKMVAEMPDIGMELYSIIENQLPFSSAGFKSRGKKILKKLAKI